MPLALVWSPQALARLRRIRAYIAKDQPGAAARLGLRIVALVSALQGHPYLGRASGIPGIRELAVGGTPYVIVYRVDPTQLVILTVRHGSQQ